MPNIQKAPPLPGLGQSRSFTLDKSPSNETPATPDATAIHTRRPSMMPSRRAEDDTTRRRRAAHT